MAELIARRPVPGGVSFVPVTRKARARKAKAAIPPPPRPTERYRLKSRRFSRMRLLKQGLSLPASTGVDSCPPGLTWPRGNLDPKDLRGVLVSSSDGGRTILRIKSMGAGRPGGGSTSASEDFAVSCVRSLLPAGSPRRTIRRESASVVRTSPPRSFPDRRRSTVSPR